MHRAILLSGLLACAAAHGAEPPVSKTDCDAALTAEVKRLEDGFSRSKDAWQKSVERRFLDQGKGLSATQMQNARATFDELVLRRSEAHVKAVALPGIYRMMLAVPQYDPGLCANPKEMRAIGDEAIVEFLRQLAELLPLVDASVDAAKANG